MSEVITEHWTHDESEDVAVDHLVLQGQAKQKGVPENARLCCTIRGKTFRECSKKLHKHLEEMIPS